MQAIAKEKSGATPNKYLALREKNICQIFAAFPLGSATSWGGGGLKSSECVEMSIGYASKLKKGVWKGKCGDPEFEENQAEVGRKVDLLVELLLSARYAIVHTGAGISTSCGIPDFRGPKGVWTLERENKMPQGNLSFADAMPSFSHKAILELLERGLIRHVVTQNVDGLHRKSGIPTENLSEIHGSAFLEECEVCGKLWEHLDQEVATI